VWCGSGPPDGRHAAEKPGIVPAGQQQPCGDVPGSEVSLGKLLEHGLIELRVSEQSLKPGVFLLQFLEALLLRRSLAARASVAFMPP